MPTAPLVNMIRAMNTLGKHSAGLTLLTLAFLVFPGCTTTGGSTAEIEPPVIETETAPPVAAPDPKSR